MDFKHNNSIQPVLHTCSCMHMGFVPEMNRSRLAVMAGRGVLVNFLNVRDVRIEPYKARLFVEREHYEKLHKYDLQCVITWLKRLTIKTGTSIKTGTASNNWHSNWYSDQNWYSKQPSQH